MTNSAKSQNVQNANLPFTFNSIKMSCSWARLQFYCFWFLLIFFFSPTNLSFIILLNSSYALKTKSIFKMFGDKCKNLWIGKQENNIFTYLGKKREKKKNTSEWRWMFQTTKHLIFDLCVGTQKKFLLTLKYGLWQRIFCPHRNR